MGDKLIYIIAEIRDREDKTCGYRLLDTETGKVTDMKCQTLRDKIQSRDIKVENNTSEHTSGYTIISTSFEIASKPYIVILDRLSLFDYKYADYKGNIFIRNIEEIKNRFTRIANGVYIEETVVSIEYDGCRPTYNWDISNSIELSDKVNKYKAKTNLLGLGSMDIQVIDDNVVLVSLDKDTERVIIPNFVTAIGNWAFSDCNSITEVSIPNSVRFIGQGAFNRCKQLRKVTIEGGDTQICKGAFYECKELVNVILPSKIKRIPHKAFFGCESLKSIIIPESVKEIGFSAFQLCKELKEIQIKGHLESLGAKAFYECNNLERVELNGADNIGDEVFAKCKSLRDINMENINSISSGMFEDCFMISIARIPEGVTHIGNGAFSGCTNIFKIVLPSTLTEIDIRDLLGIYCSDETYSDYEIINMYKLTDIIAPENLRELLEEYEGVTYI